MTVELDDREKEVLQTWLNVWSETGDFLLPGRLAYKDVLDLCDKLGLQKPEGFMRLLTSWGAR